MSAPLAGGCLCGAIRYSISTPVSELRACHCKSCQKASGGGGAVNAMLPSASFRITQGTPKRYTAIADSGRTLHRYFCGNFVRRSGGETASRTAGRPASAL